MTWDNSFRTLWWRFREQNNSDHIGRTTDVLRYFPEVTGGTVVMPRETRREPQGGLFHTRQGFAGRASQ